MVLEIPVKNKYLYQVTEPQSILTLHQLVA